MVTALVAIAVLAAFIAYMFYTYRKVKNMPEVEKHSSIKELTDGNFQNQIKNGVVLVDFWAAWCMPCKMMAPILNEVAEDIGTKAVVAKVDVETNRAVSGQYGIRNIPTLILFKNGQEINRFVGAKSKSFLVDEINKALQ